MAFHTIDGPPAGHCFSKPVSVERPSRFGPRHCGQSLADPQTADEDEISRVMNAEAPRKDRVNDFISWRRFYSIALASQHRCPSRVGLRLSCRGLVPSQCCGVGGAGVGVGVCAAAITAVVTKKIKLRAFLIMIFDLQIPDSKFQTPTNK